MPAGRQVGRDYRQQPSGYALEQEACNIAAASNNKATATGHATPTQQPHRRAAAAAAARHRTSRARACYLTCFLHELLDRGCIDAISRDASAQEGIVIHDQLQARQREGERDAMLSSPPLN